MNSNYTHYVQYLFNNYQVTDELRAYLRWYHMWIDHMIDYDRFQYVIDYVFPEWRRYWDSYCDIMFNENLNL